MDAIRLILLSRLKNCASEMTPPDFSDLRKSYALVFRISENSSHNRKTQQKTPAGEPVGVV